MTNAEFVAKLKEIGITKKEFAELSGQHQMTVSKWSEAGRGLPSWVDSWLELYEKARIYDQNNEKAKKFDKIAKEIAKKPKW